MKFIVIMREGEQDPKTGGLDTAAWKLKATEHTARLLRLKFPRALTVRIVAAQTWLAVETAQVVCKAFQCPMEQDVAFRSTNSDALLLNCAAAYAAICRRDSADVVIAIVDTAYAMDLPFHVGGRVRCANISRIGLQRNAAWVFDLAGRRMDMLRDGT